MTRLLSERAWLLARIGNEAGLEQLRRRLARRLRCEDPTADRRAALRSAARALIEAGGKTDGPRGRTIADWLDAGPDRPALSATYRSVFFTDTGQLRTTTRHQRRDQAHARHRRHAAGRGRSAGMHARRRPGRA